jgi:hypothetical protein
VTLEPFEQCGIEIERHAQLVARLAHEQLFVAAGVVALVRQPLPVSDEEVGDATSDIEVVDSGQQGLEAL